MLAEINGAELGFDDEGAGPAVLFLHARIADRSMWDHQASYFSASHRVIRLDLRGFGESTLPATPFANYEDVRALLDFLEIERATVVGISMGGDVSLDFTLAHLEQVSRLVLVSTLAAMEEPSPELKANWAAAEAAYERGDVALATEIEVEGWIVGTGRTAKDVDAEYRSTAAKMIGKIWDRVLLHSPDVEELELDPPRRERFNEISVPTLLVRGDHDFPDVPLSIEKLQAGIPGAKLVVIPNSAHLPPLERPNEFNRVLEAFVGRG